MSNVRQFVSRKSIEQDELGAKDFEQHYINYYEGEKQMTNAKKVYFHEFETAKGHCGYELITDELHAKKNNAPLASVKDLEWVSAASGEIIEGILEVVEGCVKWVETKVADPIWEDVQSGYILI